MQKLDSQPDRVSTSKNDHPVKPINGPSSALLERSMPTIVSHLPEGWTESVLALLINEPLLVGVVRHRKSKHGDHMFNKQKQRSTITVNASGNCYRFAITLLHEIAHARVHHRYLRRMKPHGREWKSAFRNLLLDHVDLFPGDLRRSVLHYAQDPSYTTDADSSLSQWLRKYGTLDLRPAVFELPFGQMFSLNGKMIMTKGKLLRKCYRCTTTDGRMYHVPPTALVHALNESSTAMGQMAAV